MVLVLLIILALAPASAQPSVAIGSYSKAACDNPPERQSSGGPASFDLNYNCDAQQPPSAWTKTYLSEEAPYQYDLVLVGAGISAAYVVHELSEHFGKEVFAKLRIGYFEKGQNAGGRLMSAFGGGALGLAVESSVQSLDYPPPEYGGMRIDGTKFPLIFKMVQEQSHFLYPDSPCEIEPETLKMNCPKMLAPMEVGAIRYVSTKSDTGPLLETSTIEDKSKLFGTLGGFSVEALTKNEGTPYDACILLAVRGIPEFYGGITNAPFLAKDAVEQACASCDKVTGLCYLCEQFSDPAAALVSCSGYDYNPKTVSTAALIGLINEITNAQGSWHLNLFIHGFQKFMQGILFSNGDIDASIQFAKELTGISFASDTGALLATSLAEQAVAALAGKAAEPSNKQPAPVQLNFLDGSVVTARAAFLTVLPADLVKIDGLHPWKKPVETGSSSEAISLVKMVLKWRNSSGFSLADTLGITPCVPGPCERLILDGPPGWLVRQVWMWDKYTIMIYESAPAEEDVSNPVWPANRMIQMAATQGMEALTTEVIKQISEATKINVPQPDWVRLKPWPFGTIAGFGNLSALGPDVSLEGGEFTTALSRPMGTGAPVFYANSEVAKNQALHGWAEGALTMVKENMPALIEILSGSLRESSSYSYSYKSQSY